KQHIYFNFPISATQAQIYQIEYDLSDVLSSRWVRTKLTDRATCMGFFSRDSNLAYNSPQLAGVKYNGMDLPYSQGSIKGGFPVRVFGSTNGRVYLADDTIVNDTTAAVQSYWDTIDFEVPQELQSVLGRWIEVELDAKGWEVDVYYSIDEGQSYVYVSSLALSSVWNKRSEERRVG